MPRQPTPDHRSAQAQAHADHCNDHARRSEVAQRYAWQARQQRGQTAIDPARLFALIRLRELDVSFQ